MTDGVLGVGKGVAVGAGVGVGKGVGKGVGAGVGVDVDPGAGVGVGVAVDSGGGVDVGVDPGGGVGVGVGTGVGPWVGVGPTAPGVKGTVGRGAGAAVGGTAYSRITRITSRSRSILRVEMLPTLVSVPSQIISLPSCAGNAPRVTSVLLA